MHKNGKKDLSKNLKIKYKKKNTHKQKIPTL